MADWVKFYCLTDDLANGEHDFPSANLTIMLSNVAPDLSDTTVTDITEITAANGYAAGGQSLVGVTISSVAGVTTIDADDVTWTATGGSIGPFRYAVIYSDFNDKLIAYLDAGISISVPDGQPATVTFGETGFLQIT